MIDKVLNVHNLKSVFKQRSTKEVEVFVNSNQVEEYEKNGFQVKKASGRKTFMTKQKLKGEIFEDSIWLLFYSLGALKLNSSTDFSIGEGVDAKQIDVFAIFDDYAFVIECKYSESDKGGLDRDDIDAFVQRIPSQRKIITNEYEVKDVFFLYITSGYTNMRGSKNHGRLINKGAFWLGDKEISYIRSLIHGYKELSFDLFVNTLLIKGQSAGQQAFKINALKTNFASHEAYITTISSGQLRKLSVVPHRSYGNVDNTLASYQRLVKYNRLTQIKKFIDEGGYFANAIIVALKDDVESEFIEVTDNSDVLGGGIGVLSVSRERSIFNIIDGQHRVYGHSLSGRSIEELLPVVALKSIDTSEQLKLFMDINQNQKKVSAKLRLDLQEDLYFDSKYPSKRMSALTSRVIRIINSNPNSLLNEQISMGNNDSGKFSALFLANGIKAGRFLPKSTGLKWSHKDLNTVIYNVLDDDVNHAMEKGIQRLSIILESNINILFETIKTGYLSDFERKFLDSNRGLMTFIKVLGDFLSYSTALNKWGPETKISKINSDLNIISSNYVKYVKAIKPIVLKELVTIQGAQVAKAWSMHVNAQISKNGYPEYYEKEITELSESRANAIYFALTEKIKSVETLMKQLVINQMQHLEGDKWDAHFGEIKYEGLKRAEQYNDTIRKKGLDEVFLEWHHKLMLIDYRKIIINKKNWSVRSKDFNLSFEQLFTIEEFSGKSASREDSTSWILKLNELRNKWAHSGTNDANFDDDDLELVTIIENHLRNSLSKVPQLLAY